MSRRAPGLDRHANGDGLAADATDRHNGWIDLRRYRVRNSIGAAGLPSHRWAAAAKARFAREPLIESARVEVVEDHDEFEHPFDSIDLDVYVRSADGEVAAALVQREFMQGLGDVVGEREVGWTAYAWVAVPDDTAV